MEGFILAKFIVSILTIVTFLYFLHSYSIILFWILIVFVFSLLVNIVILSLNLIHFLTLKTNQLSVYILIYLNLKKNTNCEVFFI